MVQSLITINSLHAITMEHPMNSDHIITRIDEVTADHGTSRDKLLPVLISLNHDFGNLNHFIINEISRRFSLSQTEVYAIASFYHLLNIQPVGIYIIRVCRTISCELSDKKGIVSALEAELGISMGETTEDNLFSLEYANCMGMCDQGPAMLINTDLHSRLTPSKAVEIINNYANRKVENI